MVTMVDTTLVSMRFLVQDVQVACSSFQAQASCKLSSQVSQLSLSDYVSRCLCVQKETWCNSHFKRGTTSGLSVETEELLKSTLGVGCPVTI